MGQSEVYDPLDQAHPGTPGEREGERESNEARVEACAEYETDLRARRAKPGVTRGFVAVVRWWWGGWRRGALGQQVRWTVAVSCCFIVGVLACQLKRWLPHLPGILYSRMCGFVGAIYEYQIRVLRRNMGARCTTHASRQAAAAKKHDGPHRAAGPWCLMRSSVVHVDRPGTPGSAWDLEGR